MKAEQSRGGQEQNHEQAVQHVTEATRILRTLQHDLDENPEIQVAIQKLELALAILAVKTGGML